MKADASNEQCFIADVDAFEFIAHDVGKVVQTMEDWLAQLSASLQSNRFTCDGLNAKSALAMQADAVNAALQDSVQTWTREWVSLEPAKTLAETFDDKVLLLVFGKFNAGKSSFCNLIAERFASYGKAVEYFYLEGGRIVETPEPFKEGVTETTARLQGVRLAGKLVLLDTPGLHSVTPENAALTQRFTDSADGVLWLTSSTSPGQVQELDELGRELHRNKPLLPVVTRSDVYEEDEIDGEIRKFLRNKTARNRAEQEADIETRAKEKLVAMDVAAELLKTPVSISSHLAREQGQTRAAMTDAGFERLYAALLEIVEPVLAYKRRKQAEVLLHHLEENVMGALCSEVSSLLGKLRASSDAAISSIGRQQEQLANAVWRSVMPTLPELLEKHSAARDVNAILVSVSRTIAEAFSQEAAKRLCDYDVELHRSPDEFEFDKAISFEDIVIERTGPDGYRREIVGVDYQRLHAALSEAIRDHILRLARGVASQCEHSLKHLMQRAHSLETLLQTHEKDLLGLKRSLRSEFA
jgi:predicted GTPase